MTAPGRSLSVYAAEAGTVESVSSGPSCREGFTGGLALQGVEVFDQDEAGAVLARLDHLVRWAQAQQARVLNRLEGIFRNGFLPGTGSVEGRQLDPGLAFSLAAEEAAAILHLPTGTAKMLMIDAGTLCHTHTATLQHLEAGSLGYGQVQTVLEQSQNIPAADLPGFEQDLLVAAGQQGGGGLTLAQFRVKARRLRETRYPETIPVRHQSAFETRRVCLQPDTDGMSWLSAFLPAQRAQAIYTQLSVAARGEQAAGDPRPVDQLRADILADLLTSGARAGDPGSNTDGKGDGDGVWVPGANETQNSDSDPVSRAGETSDSGAGKNTSDQDRPVRHGSGARTEILVLITAETLLGADEDPAELHGYGPISAETARRLARQAARWTPVERTPHIEEVLRVGRRRKVPPGLQRWLRARDGTCRFPGCRTNALISEIDHTTPWSRGGATDHDNLEHLCRRHHMFKTRGFWKARQHSPGIIEWVSPGGRTYRTEPHLHLAPGSGTDPVSQPTDAPVDDPNPYDYGDDPPPF
ncbi:DUF222 domain-containing protein [Arthrobacter sp. NPDC097144]|uniref:HNH endonuclease n=1 Tax=Arthrobacter sp. NPDC097144 TaxID=3363946 RepID=UPI00382E893E